MDAMKSALKYIRQIHKTNALPAKKRVALRDVIERASDECGLTPTGHKFVVYLSTVGLGM
jgi:hypothetical protein